MITIVDYGMGNLGSIQNMLKKIGAPAVEISAEVNTINNAQKLILPGVGAFDKGMTQLKERGLIDLLNKRVLQEKVPVLGICLGMQLLTNSSEEGQLPGLGWVDAQTLRFQFEDQKLKVPHMGWNTIQVQKQVPLAAGLNDESRFYFVHSYYVKTNRTEDSLFQTHYGLDFTSGVHKDNIMGVQFHPEKSHRFGMQLLENFVKL